MTAFWTAFSLILVTEIADKSRVAGLLLVTTYRAPWPIFFGMTLGYALLEGIAVFLGGMIPVWVPQEWISKVVGALFIAIGAAAFFLGEETERRARGWLGKIEAWGPFLVSFIAISISEIADRTQIAAAALSASTGKPWSVYAGAMGALTLLNGLTVWVGDRVAGRFSPRIVHRFAGACFVLFGLALLAS